MKYLIIILLLTLSISAKSQVRYPTGFPTQSNMGWNKWGYAMSDSGLIVANRDTNWLAKYSATIVFKPSNKQFYWFDSTTLRWNQFGTVIDTTSLSNRINLKLNISDTSSMLSPYLRKIDTTNHWVQDIYARNDSLFKFKNGTETFVDTLNGGGGGGSGSVTSVALSMPSAFSVSGSPITTSGTLAVTGAGTSSQYIRGNGTLATTDTTMIPVFSEKVRSLFSGISPITFNQATGGIGIGNANASGTKGAATFNNSDFTDNGSGLISLRNGPVYFINNGLTKNVDSIQLGGTLTKTTFIRESLNRSNIASLSNKFLYLGNVGPDSSAYINYFIDSNNYDRPCLILNKMLYNNDTLDRVYGGVLQGATRITFDSSNTRFNNPSTPMHLPYGGANMLSQVFPPDTSYISLSPFGQTGSVYSGDIGVGGDNPYYINYISSQDQYPMPVYRAGFDYARQNTFIKREMRGNSTGGFIWDFRDYQANISAGTPNYGNYINKNFGFMAYGTIYTHNESPSKAKTLSVATIDTSIGFWARPMWTSLNEIKNGYAFFNEGTNDYNFFAGYTKMGGTMPSVSNPQTRRLYVDSTMQVGQTLSSNAYFTNYWKRLNVTSANFNSTSTRGMWVQNELWFDQDVSISSSGITAVRGELDLYADSVQTVQSTTGVGVMGANFGLFLRKKTGYADTTTFKGATTAASCAAALTSRFDMSDAQISGRENLGTGYFASFQPNFEFSNFNKLDNAIWVNIGTGQFQGATNVLNGYGIYINGFPSQVTNKYALYQDGLIDTVMLNGKIKIPNLSIQSDTTNNKPVVIDANGNIFKSYWAGGSGGAVSSVSNSDGSLTFSPTTGPVVGSINVGHSNAFTVSQSITSSTQLGLQVNMSNTADGTYAINLNRASTSVENAFNYSTAGVAQYFVGQNNDASNDFVFYSWVPNKFAFTIDGTTVDVKFGNSLTALVVKNDGSAISMNSLNTSNAAPATTGTTKMVITDAVGQLSFTALPISSLNSLTAATQTFATGTSGSDFNISSSSSTHTFNIPSASTSNRGLVTTTSQTFGGAKTFNDGAIVTFPSAGSGTSLVVSGNRSLGTAPGISGVGLQLASFTYTNTEASTTESGAQNFHLINTPTLTSSNAVTYSGDVSTIRFVGAPISGGSSTISHPWNIFANDVNYFQTISMGLNEQSGDATLGNGSVVAYTGSGGNTFTLPALATHPGKTYFIKNGGSGNLSVSRAGSDNLWDTSSVTSITIAAGGAVIISAGSSFWWVQKTE